MWDLVSKTRRLGEERIREMQDRGNERMWRRMYNTITRGKQQKLKQIVLRDRLISQASGDVRHRKEAYL